MNGKVISLSEEINQKKKLIKFLFIAVVIYFFINIIPGEKVKILNSLLITLLSTILIFSIDYIFPSKQILKPIFNTSGKSTLRSKNDNCNCDMPITQQKPYVGIEIKDNSQNSLDSITGLSKIAETSKLPDNNNIGTTKIANLNEENKKVISDEMQYSQLPPEMHQPIGKKQQLDSEGKYGELFVPQDQWYPPTYRPPICVTSNKCQTQPIYAGIEYATLREIDESRRIMPPDNINEKYIAEKLNSGK